MQLAVIGTGLIGCSFARAARAAGLFQSIVGIDPAHGERALALGHVDAVADAPPRDAQAIFIATPADHIVPWLRRLQDHPGIVFDAGSVKAALLTEIASAGMTLPPRFVPCHPIAGSERSGPEAALPDLFAGRLLVITPLPATAPDALAQVRGWWQTLGARVREMAPEAHDRTFALTSHLPHLAAFAYMQLIADEDLEFAAGGFRDFSRIAASDPDMWVPILRYNRAAILESLAALQQALSEMGALVAAGADEELRARLIAARDRRQRYDAG